MIKQLLMYIMVTIILFATLSGSAFAVSDISGAADKTTIKIGYIAGSSHIIQNQSTSTNGIGYDYFTEIEKYSNLLFEHIECSQSEIFELLQSGEIDLIGPVSISNDYTKQNFIHTKSAITTSQIVLATPINSGLAYNDYLELENHIIAMDNLGEFNAYENLLLQFETENNLKLNTVSLTNLGSATFEINTGEYDVKLMEWGNSTRQLEVIASLGNEELHYIALPENSELIAEIDSAMDIILSVDHAYPEKLYVKYLEDSQLAMPSYSLPQKEYLDSIETINVFYSGSNEPYQYTSEQGEASGITVQIMKLIEQDLGIQFNFIQDNISNDELKNTDLSICFLSTDKMVGSYEKTSPYLNLPLSLIGRPQEETQDYFFVGAMPYLDANIEDALKTYGSYIIAYYDTNDEMVQLLNKDMLNFVVVPASISEYVVENDGQNHHFEYELDYSYPLQILISNEAGQELKDILNLAIERLDYEQVDSIVAQSTLGNAPQDTLLDLLLRNLEVTLMVIMLIVLAFILLAWYGNVRRQKDLLKIINIDSLTGAYSKYAFFEMVKKILENAKPGQYALYCMDVDNFKIINESYGYGKGSQIIVQLAKFIGEAFKNKAIVAREANDKFLVLVEIDNGNEQININNKGKENMLFRLALRQILDDDYSLNVSVGKYKVEDPKLDLDYMVDCANYARLLAKNKYGNTLVNYTQEMNKKRKMQNEIVSGMEHALFADEFEVYYQPKICLKTEEIVGAEALVRWMRNGKPLFFPDQFIPLFEDNRFIVRLDYYMVQHVCKFVQKNYDLLKNITVSINLSGITIMDEKLMESIVKVVSDKLKLNKNIEFEVTESAFIENFDFVVSAIKGLRQKGFTISMDDFGSGLSSYNRLKDIPLDILKIDKEFCMYSLNDEKGRIIVESIINLAKQINLKIVAEGVETRLQADTLSELGCDMAQGYLFAKPMQGKEFLKMIEEKHIEKDNV